MIRKPTVLVGPPVLVLPNDKLVMEKFNNYVVGISIVYSTQMIHVPIIFTAAGK